MKANPYYYLENLLIKFPQLEICRSSIAEAFELLRVCYTGGGKVLTCGNGGSAADAEHIVGELMKGFLLKRKISKEHTEKLVKVFGQEGRYLADNLQGAMPAVSLVSQSALNTAFINDVAADMVFAQQVYGYGSSKDVLIALSTSGNSKNVVNAVKVARILGMRTIGMTGEGGGVMKDLCDVAICVPSSETYRIQEYHLPVYHAICAMIEAQMFSGLE